VYGEFGNKTSSTTSACAGASALAQFSSKTTTMDYAAQTVTIGGVTVSVPRGAFATTASNPLNQSEQRRYDPRFGAVTQLTGPNGLVTNWTLDEFGRKVLESRADGTSTATYYCWGKVYDPASDAMVDATTSNNSSNSAGCHNGSAPVIAAPRPGEMPSTAVRYEHVVDMRAGAAIGGFSRVYFDRLGRKVRAVVEGFDGDAQPSNARLVVQDTDYNDYGAAIVSTQPYFLDTGSSTTTVATYGLTLTEYDALGRATTIYTSDPTSTGQKGGNGGVIDVPNRGTRQMAKSTVAYRGLVNISTDDQGNTRTEEKNLTGQVVRVTDALGAQIVHEYDAFGNLVTTKDPLGNRVVVDYDVRGRKLSINDPDAGVTAYCYDALGQLRAQQTSAMRGGHALTACPDFAPTSVAPQIAGWTTMAYDVLGRMTSRSEAEYTTSWTFDSCAMGIGKLCQSSTSHGVTRQFVYDSLGRPVNQRTDIAGDLSAANATAFDANGRVLTQTYPTGVKIRYQYTSKGFLSAVLLDTAVTIGDSVLSAGSPIWKAGVANAWGKAETSSYGNGVANRAAYDPETGRLVGLTAGKDGGNGVVNQRYTWDSLGWMSQRVDAIGDTGTIEVSDGFSYDAVGRLTAYAVSGGGGSRTVTLQYNALGMMLSKSDVGGYVYPQQGVVNGRPHAVQGIPSLGVSYAYDLNGNATLATSGKWRGVTYTSFNMVDVITGADGGTSRWKYDESHQRIKETKASRVTWYMHPDNAGALSFEREVASNGTQSNRHYLSAGGQVIAVLVTNGQLPTLVAGTTAPPDGLGSVRALKLEYWHKDHLGSLIATTDHVGNVTARYAYDPFGKRRFTNSSYDANGSLVVDWTTDGSPGTDRGFTGHEHLDDFGIIHMNGRLYDPTIARMMQPDPFVQEMLNLQNYDRYGYCFNSPLICTDPTGYSFLSKAWKRIWKNPIFRMIAVIVINYYLPGAGNFLEVQMGVTNVIANAAISGFVSGAVMSGNLKGGLQGAFTAGVFAGVGNFLSGVNTFGANFADVRAAQLMELGVTDTLTKVALHGVAGCITSAAGGGKCGDGALSAAFSEFATAKGLQFEGRMGVVSAAMIGGTASVLGGGKFANGAVTAAAGYLFNHLVHSASEARALYGKGAGPGHHWVPFGSTTDLDISVDAREVWGLATNGADLPSSVHRWDPDHVAYNAAVRDELLKFSESRGIDLAKMTADEARDFLGTVKTSNNPAISRLVTRIEYYMSRSPSVQRLIRRFSAVGAMGAAEWFYPSPMRAPQCQFNPNIDGC
jgi:RHS repeat-associated protein